MSSHQAYEIAADDEDDEDIIATSGASLLPSSAAKGKGRATSPSPSTPDLSGKIGSSSPGIGVGERTSRQTVGGVQTETR